jgi:hypothetical protein
MPDGIMFITGVWRSLASRKLALLPPSHSRLDEPATRLRVL